MADKPATGGKRFFKLASMTASVATRYATSKLKSAFLEGDEAESERSKLHEVNGAKIVETLGELKGAVMKVGQMASITKDVLPKEIGDALSALQKEAPPMSFDIIAQQIERELELTHSISFHVSKKSPSQAHLLARFIAQQPTMAAKSL